MGSCYRSFLHPHKNYNLIANQQGVKMLILTRKVGESIIINDNIHITVLDGASTQTRIGINAPEHVKVYREELYKRLQGEAHQPAEPQCDKVINDYYSPPYA